MALWVVEFLEAEICPMLAHLGLLCDKNPVLVVKSCSCMRYGPLKVGNGVVWVLVTSTAMQRLKVTDFMD